MSEFERWIAVSDTHGDHIHAHSRDVVFKFIDEWKPTQRFHLGDAVNLAALRKGASDGEQREDIDGDVDAGCAFMRDYRPTVFCRGNHCERAWRLLNSDDGKMRTLGREITERITAAIGDAVMLPYCKRRGIYQYGDLRLMHGFYGGESATRRHAMAYSKCLHGHNHAVDCASVPRMEDAIGWGIGCLCDLLQDYNSTHVATLRQGHGFAWGIKMPSGKVIVNQARSYDGLWVVPTSLAVIKPGDADAVERDHVAAEPADGTPGEVAA